MTSPLHYAKQMLANPLEAAQQFLSFDKLLMESRLQLLKSYGVPEINEQLVELDALITQIDEKLVDVTKVENQNEWWLNATLLQFYSAYDEQKSGSIASHEWELLVTFFLKLLNVPIEEKHIAPLARIMDVNQDGRYSKDEIVRSYTKEEIKDYFESKRKKIELEIKLFKDYHAKSKEKKANKARVKKEVKSQDKGQEEETLDKNSKLDGES